MPKLTLDQILATHESSVEGLTNEQQLRYALHKRHGLMTFKEARKLLYPQDEDLEVAGRKLRQLLAYDHTNALVDCCKINTSTKESDLTDIAKVLHWFSTQELEELFIGKIVTNELVEPVTDSEYRLTSNYTAFWHYWGELAQHRDREVTYEFTIKLLQSFYIQSEMGGGANFSITGVNRMILIVALDYFLRYGEGISMAKLAYSFIKFWPDKSPNQIERILQSSRSKLVNIIRNSEVISAEDRFELNAKMLVNWFAEES